MPAAGTFQVLGGQTVSTKDDDDSSDAGSWESGPSKRDLLGSSDEEEETSSADVVTDVFGDPVEPSSRKENSDTRPQARGPGEKRLPKTSDAVGADAPLDDGKATPVPESPPASARSIPKGFLPMKRDKPKSATAQQVAATPRDDKEQARSQMSASSSKTVPPPRLRQVETSSDMIGRVIALESSEAQKRGPPAQVTPKRKRAENVPSPAKRRVVGDGVKTMRDTSALPTSLSSATVPKGPAIRTPKRAPQKALTAEHTIKSSSSPTTTRPEAVRPIVDVRREPAVTRPVPLSAGTASKKRRLECTDDDTSLMQQVSALQAGLLKLAERCERAEQRVIELEAAEAKRQANDAKKRKLPQEVQPESNEGRASDAVPVHEKKKASKSLKIPAYAPYKVKKPDWMKQ